MSLEIGLSIDILNLEWPNSDRDLHIVTPTLVYLNKKHNLTYKTESIFNGYYYIWKYKPKILLISNFSGAIENHEIVKTAYNSGIKVVSLISEGNVKAEALEQFLWGWNKDRKLYVDKMLLWSNRSRNIFLSKYPELENKLAVSGATGFDRYKLLKFKTKQDFLKENNLEFKKIIGIAGWGFDHFFGDYYKRHKEIYEKIYGEKQIKIHREDLFKLQKIYKKIIQNNRDILFILRYHPGTVDFKKNEFFGLENEPNVFISKKGFNFHYSISDLINVSDIWIGYETTTALEAWLLGKQTFLINPTTKNFIRENVHKGSPIVRDEEETQSLINEFYENGSIKKFENLEIYRNEIIKDTIEYGDGKNYIRAANEILKIYKLPSKNTNYNFNFYKNMFIQIIKIFLAKTLYRQKLANLNYNSNFAKKYQQIYEKAIDV